MYKEYCDMIDTLTAVVKSEISKGIFSQEVNGEAVGKIVDMIKDLEEAKKSCYEACYYKTVVKAMKEAGEEEEEEDWDDDMMGYNPNRSMSTGRYMSSRGGRHGYTPNMMRQMPYIDSYLYDPDQFKQSMRHMRYSDKMGESGMMSDSSEQGRDYENYRRARRHYTESKDASDKTLMDNSAKKYVRNAVQNMKEMVVEADPTLRKDMKENLTALISMM